MTASSVPKSMTRIREEIQGMPFWYVVIAASFLVLSVGLIAAAALSGFKGQVLCLILLFIEVTVFAVYLRTPKKMERSELMAKYLFRSLKGEAIKGIVPISATCTLSN